MKLSVVIPVYNAESFLKRCLDSVLACDSREIECILVDDGSKDHSLSICKEYQAGDSRIHIISKENSGVSDSRNEGILQATGDYIFFLDADDYMNQEKWPVLLKWCNMEIYDFVAFGRNTFFENGTCVEGLFSFKEESTEDLPTLRKMMFADSVWNECWGKLYKRETLLKNHILFQSGLKVGEDTRFVTDVFLVSKRPVAVSQNVLYYCQHGSSVIHSVSLTERMSYMNSLYQYGKEKSAGYHDYELDFAVNNYYFNVVTNLILVYSKNQSLREIKVILQTIKADCVVREIQRKVQTEQLSARKKIEFRLLSKDNIITAAIYFKLKSYLYKG